MFSRENFAAVGRAIAVVAVGFLVSLAVGTLLKTDAVSSADADVFNEVVPELQQNSTFVELMEFATQLGSIPINFAMSFILGLFAAIVHRKIIFAPLAPAVMFGAHFFQNLTIEVIGREVPVDFVIGDSGGYFSGGVMRVVILTVMLLTFALPKMNAKLVFGIALFAGLFEALTRFTLGRHWPLDMVAALPIGLMIGWAFRTVANSFFGPTPDILDLPGLDSPAADLA